MAKLPDPTQLSGFDSFSDKEPNDTPKRNIKENALLPLELDDSYPPRFEIPQKATDLQLISVLLTALRQLVYEKVEIGNSAFSYYANTRRPCWYWVCKSGIDESLGKLIRYYKFRQKDIAESLIKKTKELAKEIREWDGRLNNLQRFWVNRTPMSEVVNPFDFKKVAAELLIEVEDIEKYIKSLQKAEQDAKIQVPDDKRKKIKEPSKKAIQAYLLYKSTSWSQTVCAEYMNKELKPKVPFRQDSISRLVTEAKNWLEASGLDVFPKHMTTNILIMDPYKLEMGARQDGKITGDPHHMKKKIEDRDSGFDD